MEEETPTTKTRKIGRRLFVIYVLKRKNKFQEACQLTTLEGAVYDHIQAGSAGDEEEARSKLVTLLSKEDLYTASLEHTLLRIPLSITSDDFDYVGEPMRTFTQKLMNWNKMHFEVGMIFDQIRRACGGNINKIPKTFNSFAVVERRDSSSSRIGYSLKNPQIFEYRAVFKGNYAIYRAFLRLRGRPIIEYLKPYSLPSANPGI